MDDKVIFNSFENVVIYTKQFYSVIKKYKNFNSCLS